MKKKLCICFLFISFIGFSQEKHSYIQADYFYANILNTNPDGTVFLQGHPTGVFASYNTKTTGIKDWQGVYNYPDVGISFSYQDYKSDILSELYAIYGHYNFYLLNRSSKNQLIIRAGIGLSYTSKPYHKETNNKNVALGTYINAAGYSKLYYQRNYILGNLGFTAGLTLAHSSNGNFKSPNSGINIWGATVGLNYNLSKKEPPINFIPTKDTLKVTEPIKINLAIRGGVNESPIIGSGLKPFFVVSAYIDKRISRKSAFQLGTELFISPMLKDYYEIESARPGATIEEPNSYSRIGGFIGYELFINRLSLEAQLGYYLKNVVISEGAIYETLGLKRYFGEKWFASIRVKAHGANAESTEFGIGIRI